MKKNAPLTELFYTSKEEENQWKYKSVPMYAIPKPKRYKLHTANGLTQAIIDFIKSKGYQAERIDCQGRVIDNRITYTDAIGRTKTIGSIKRIRTSAQIGTADVSATIKGRSIKIEVKINDRQSKEQKEYQETIEKAGGVYLVVKEFEAFISWFNGFVE